MLDHCRKTYHREQQELREWLRGRPFTHYVTLATNNQMMTVDTMKDRLRAWDAHVNHALLGKKWAKPSWVKRRMEWEAVPEKLGTNPHWHILLKLQPEHIAADDGVSARSFSSSARSSWSKLVPTGTTNIQVIETQGVVDYVSKSTWRSGSFENMMCSWELIKNDLPCKARGDAP